MMKLSQIPAPAVAGVIREKTKAAAAAEIKNCYLDGADMIDLHLSCLQDRSIDYLKSIIRASRVPVLALNYNMTFEKTPLGLTEEERVQSLLDALDAGAAGIDMQGYTFDARSEDAFFGEDKYSFTKNAPKEVVTDPAIIAKQREVIDEVHKRGGEVLLSCHPGIPMTTEQVVDLALFLEERSPDIIKIVTKAVTEEDTEEAIRTMIALKHAVKTPVSYHANGKVGMLSRIVNPILGGQIIFSVDRYKEGSTMEQVPLKLVRSIVDNVRKL